MKSFLSTLLLSGLAVASSRPNILFVLTDDQDKHMNSPEYMPNLQVGSRPLHVWHGLWLTSEL